MKQTTMFDSGGLNTLGCVLPLPQPWPELQDMFRFMTILSLSRAPFYPAAIWQLNWFEWEDKTSPTDTDPSCLDV